ncbi:metallopeptidase TldD-related protein [Miniphocaeibacter halophilus]|uniref:Uncharacterized protein n=1 Tax=Miniphocaeibacter halophilus TaxID=2931922 RepID=A0AC61MR61_9FIRM|nr:metallopeptidase TldD-related protein [Miniphocaeibacter halophilus]QQK07952.1 hypothetical protein JFY71_11915 [Miniphocaeibacter halophilus]
MIKELYIKREKQIIANILNNKINKISRKDRKNNSIRYYDGSNIGFYSFLGEDNKEYYEKAKNNLRKNIKYEEEITKNIVRKNSINYEEEITKNIVRKNSINYEEEITKNIVRKNSINYEYNEEEFINKAKKLIFELNKKFPEFIFSNNIKMFNTKYELINDLNTDLYDEDFFYLFIILIKHRKSINVFDSGFLDISREFNIRDSISKISKILTKFEIKVDLPKESKIPIIFNNVNFDNKLIQWLNPKNIEAGNSELRNKEGKQIFNSKLNITINRTKENFDTPFFDLEGSVIENDKFYLIKNGIFIQGYADKAISSKYNIKNTAAAFGEYNDLPSIDKAQIHFENTADSLKKLLGSERAIYVDIYQGGDYNEKGDYSTPIQSAYLYEDGEIIGRLPEFSAYNNIYEMFGKDFIGVCIDNEFGGFKNIVTKMNIARSK